ncbi:archease [archaeon]|nr:archease [archaeon]
MDYEFFEHEADQGIRCYGETTEKAFENGAKALFEIMCDTTKVEPITQLALSAKAKDLDLLFIEWLNELLSQKDIEMMFFSEFKVTISKNEEYLLEAIVSGEPMDVEKHGAKLEAKAATYTALKSGEKDGKKFFQCIVDV